MIINLQDVGKKYDRHWVFRHFTTSLLPNNQYVLLGNNGSGKSTLLKIIAGLQQASEGMIQWQLEKGHDLKKEMIYHHVSFCAPAMDIIDEMTLEEFLQFHFSFKKMKFISNVRELIDLLKLSKDSTKKISDFSSGMKQRVKLAQAFFSDTTLLCLDEPTSNLDEEWIAFYQECLLKYTVDRTVVIASNDDREYTSDNIFHLHDFK